MNGVYWEMPNVTPLGDKWLFTTTPMQSTRGVRTIYWLGDIADDGKFVPTSGTVEEPQTIELSGVAKDGYGLLSPSSIPAGESDTISKMMEPYMGSNI